MHACQHPESLKCITCELPCELKGSTSLKMKDLANAPGNCPYIIELKKAVTIPTDYIESITRDFQPVIESFKIVDGLREVYRRIVDFNEYYSRQQETISHAIRNLLSPQLAFKDYLPLIKQMNAVSEYFSRLSQNYYTLRDFEPLYRPLAIPKEERPLELIERLSSCPKGREYWEEFQTLCKEIFIYLFVPPLGEPIEESRTETGLQRRDIIFPIPYDAGGFWEMIKHKHHAEALIVECKNYSEPIEANEIVITSKYLGRKRLGMFAIVISRCPPAESAVGEVKRYWFEEEKLILCLDDKDLQTMIQLKENGEDPEILIDKIRFDFLQSLE